MLKLGTSTFASDRFQDLQFRTQSGALRDGSTVGAGCTMDSYSGERRLIVRSLQLNQRHTSGRWASGELRSLRSLRSLVGIDLRRLACERVASAETFLLRDFCQVSCLKLKWSPQEEKLA